MSWPRPKLSTAGFTLIRAESAVKSPRGIKALELSPQIHPHTTSCGRLGIVGGLFAGQQNRRLIGGGIKALQQVAYRPEAAAVMQGHAMQAQAVIMFGRAIALVAAP